MGTKGSSPIKENVMKIKLVLVTWEDACSHSRWIHPEDVANCDLVEVVTCGFLVNKGKKITQVGLLCDGEKFADMIAIPTANVKKIEVLKVINKD